LETDREYSVITAIAMVVGCVIGSGVFFKTETLIIITRGNCIEALMARIAGGVGMLVCLLSFVCIVRNNGNTGGLVEISKNTVGENYAYYIGWFMATVYYPALSGVLSWLSARYTLLAFGTENPGGRLCMLVACLYLIVCSMQNTFAQSLSGKVQITATVLKLIPLILMIVFGTESGINSGNLRGNMSVQPETENACRTFFRAVSAVLFAYEGWIAGLSIGSELRNSKKNMPRALLSGGIIVVSVYILYYIGVVGSVPIDTLLEYGNGGIKYAFSSVLGKSAASLLIVFVAISCYGALNGMMFSAGRMMLEVRKTNGNRTKNSSGTELMLSAIWLFLFFGFSVSGKRIFGGFGFDVSEIPVITVYSLYIPIFCAFLKKRRTNLSNKAIVTVTLGIISCIIMVICAFFAHIKDVSDYFLMLTAIMLTGVVLRKK